jgi:hypothetical protein
MSLREVKWGPFMNVDCAAKLQRNHELPQLLALSRPIQGAVCKDNRLKYMMETFFVHNVSIVLPAFFRQTGLWKQQQ